MRKYYSTGGPSTGKTPTTPKEKKFAALAPPPNKITFSDKIVGASRKKAMGGGMMRKQFGKGGGADTHVTKDGRTVKKGLYYYMNRAKKKGTSKPGKGSVTDKALKASAKTAKKPTKKA